MPVPISLPVAHGKFNFRVAGVAIQDGKVLLHKTEEDRFWSLPGGRVEIFEFTRETLLREMIEETGNNVEVLGLAWVAENFFQYNDIDHHEIGFYYTMTFLNLTDQDEFTCTDGDNELIFKWFPLSELDQISIYPEFITPDLLLNMSNTVNHFTSGLQNLHL